MRLGRARLLLAFALPGCLLVDPPQDVRTDGDAGSESTAGLTGSAASAGIGAGAAGGKGGAGGRGGAGSAGAGNAGTGGAAAGNGGAGGSGTGGSSGKGGTAGSGGMGATSGGAGGSVTAGGASGVGGAGGAGGAGGSVTAGATNGGSGGGAGMGQASKCGNDVPELGEDCDDGGTLPGDGCSPTCKLESGWSCTGDEPSSCSPTYPSCAGMSGTECFGEDCCESLGIDYGTFTQGDSSEGTFESTVAGFKLDRFEVTVARFRAFFAAYGDWAPANPTAGAGAHPKVANSGWSTDWELPASPSELASALDCDSASQSWVSTAGNDTLPMNCIDWFTAFAFCIWDGGRLPTEAEWEITARWGGYEQPYPWGESPALTNEQDYTAEYAVYNCLGDGSAGGVCSTVDILSVGSKPDGASWAGVDDLLGSVSEWMLDWYAPYPTGPRMDYANVAGSGVQRTVRGGSWADDADYQSTVLRMQYEPTTTYAQIGFRCARSR